MNLVPDEHDTTLTCLCLALLLQPWAVTRWTDVTLVLTDLDRALAI